MQIGTSRLIIEKGKAAYPAIYLLSAESTRSIGEIQEAAKELKRDFYYWVFTEGLYKDPPEKKHTNGLIEDTQNPDAVLDYIKKLGPKSLVVLHNFHEFLEDPGIKAKFLRLIPAFKLQQKMVVILTPVLKMPPELEKEVTLVETELPDKETLTSVLDGIITASKDAGQLKSGDIPDSSLKQHLISSALGLTTQEAENAFALSYVKSNLEKVSGRKWDPSVVLKEKCASLRKSGLLEYYPTEGIKMDNVGGFKNYKIWLSKRIKAFSEEAREFGLPHPKGILFIGPPGSGKSLAAKATSSVLGLPLLRCDIGRIFGSLVGQSEANVRTVIQTAEAISPCVCWIDEVEKGFAGMSGGQTLDSGVGARVFSSFLTWMSEKTSPVFVVATANDVSALPPELLRKGRFDEMFFVNLPTKSERKEIFEIHIRKFGRIHLVGSNPKVDLDYFAKKTEGFSGSEIEESIKEALWTAFNSGKDLNFVDLEDAIDATMPLSRTMSERLERQIAWCKGRARPANAPELVEAQHQSQGSRALEN